MSLVILFLLIIYGKQNKELSNWHRILYLTGGMLCKSDKPSIIIIIMLCKSDKPSIIIIIIIVFNYPSVAVLLEVQV